MPRRFAILFQFETFPDLEGIKTIQYGRTQLYKVFETFPDLEGIKTGMRRM